MKDHIAHGRQDFSDLKFLVVNNDVLNFSTDSDERLVVAYYLFTTSEKGNPRWDFIINNVATTLHIPQPIISRLFTLHVAKGYLIRHPRVGRTGAVPHKLDREKLLSAIVMQNTSMDMHNEMNKDKITNVS
jgi:hypothetical protein